MSKFPKFEDKLKDRVLTPEGLKQRQPAMGVVVGYDEKTHTATVMASRPDSDQVGQIFQGVPCPIVPGVQQTAPAPGSLCWLLWRTPTTPAPMISHFFNNDFYDAEHQSQYSVKNDIPRFLDEV